MRHGSSSRGDLRTFYIGRQARLPCWAPIPEVWGRRLHVHGGAVGEFVEQAGGDVVAALSVGEGEKNGIVGGLALLGAMQSESSQISSF
jgi:hypothetical protein